MNPSPAARREYYLVSSSIKKYSLNWVFFGIITLMVRKNKNQQVLPHSASNLVMARKTCYNIIKYKRKSTQKSSFSFIKIY